MSNVQRLSDAGVLKADELTRDQQDFINNHLSGDEVDSIISITQKLGKTDVNFDNLVIHAL